MENYYTTRFHAPDWPPASGAIPPGIEWKVPELVETGSACCVSIEIRSVAVRPLETRWAYSVTYRLGCPNHGESTATVMSRLDWISPNEYLLIRVPMEDDAMNTRDDAWRLLTEWTKSESLLKHALAVEAAMRFYAREFGEDEELWGCTGLLHDFDYERNPEPPDHPTVGMAKLREAGWPDAMIHAIGGHAPYLGIPRESALDKTLFAVDELCGLIMAVAYTRPSRTLAEVEVSSVIKKMKQSGFARGVSRDDIAQGAAEMGLSLDKQIANCLAAMQAIAADLGL